MSTTQVHNPLTENTIQNQGATTTYRPRIFRASSRANVLAQESLTLACENRELNPHSVKIAETASNYMISPFNFDEKDIIQIEFNNEETTLLEADSEDESSRSETSQELDIQTSLTFSENPEAAAHDSSS